MADFLQDKKTCVILGATSGVGTALASKLDSCGYHLLLLGRDVNRLNTIRDSLSSPDKHISRIVEDWQNLTDLTSILKYGEQTMHSKVSMGVYTAGIGPLIALRAINWENVSEIMNVNFITPMLFIKRLTEHWKLSADNKTELKKIVLISSVSAHKGQKGFTLYGGSKAALSASVRDLALKLAVDKILVNCISPGWLNTKANDNAEKFVPGLHQLMETQHPLGTGTTAYIAGAVEFLLSEKANWITGTDLIVDGGFLAG